MKNADGTTDSDGKVDVAGDVINYKVVFTNTGTQTLHNVTVTNSLTTLTCSPTVPAASLAPGAAITCTGSYTVTQADIDNNGNPLANGFIHNVATGDSNETDSQESFTDTPLLQSATSSTVKTVDSVKNADGTTDSDGKVDVAGDVINYKVVFTNTGTQTLHNVTVTDSLTTLTCSPTVPAASLAPGAAITCTGSYTVTQADIDNNGNPLANGFIHNVATGDSNETDSQESFTDTPLLQSATSSTVKTVDSVKNADGTTDSDGKVDVAGDVINYKVVFTNTGTQTLHNVTVTDSLTTLTCSPTVPAASLAPGAAITCTGSYTVTQADIDNNGNPLANGFIHNVATGDSNETDSQESFTDTPLLQSATSSTVKTVDSVKNADGTTDSDGKVDVAGDVINYKVVFTNTGTQTLHNVTVTDSLTTLTCSPTVPAASLAPGAAITCTGSYTVTQADIDNNGNPLANGFIHNVATGDSNETDSQESFTDTPLLQSATSSTVKTVDSVKNADGTTDSDGKVDVAGDVINYKVVFTNTGTQTLHNVTVTDSLTTLTCSPTVPAASLAPGAAITCTGSYTVTQADIDNNGNPLANGFIHNVATGDSNETDSQESFTDTPLLQSATSSTVKTVDSVKNADGTTDSDGKVDVAGDVINYKVVFTNTGTQTLHNVTVTDSLTTLTCSPTVPAASLAPGAAITCTGSYTVTQADIDNNGNPWSTASSDVATGDANETESQESFTDTPLLQSATSSTVKTVYSVKNADGTTDSDGKVDVAGDVINYKVVFTNTGTERCIT